MFFQSFILMIGGFIAPYIRRITPRAALLGTLAGVSITFISMRPALEMFMTPAIGILCFAVILVSWFGGFKYPKGMPAGLVAIAVGMVIAWGSTLFGFSYGGMSLQNVADAFANFGFSVPLPAFDEVFSGFEFLGVILVTAIPFGIYDLVEAMDNVESAEAAGDAYPTTRVLTADGVVSLIGCLMGNPFINAVYIGHPGWKAMGGRIGYSAATGVMVIVLSWFGIIAVMSSLIPLVAISPILLYIGMLIGAQAFQETPKKPRAGHRPGAGAAPCRLVQDTDGWGARGRWHQRRDGGNGQACPGGCALSRACGVGGWRDPVRPGARRHCRLHHREEIHGGLGIRRDQCSAHILRLHAWGDGGICGDAHRRGRLCGGRGIPVWFEPISGDGEPVAGS